MADNPTRGGAMLAMVGLVAVIGVAATIFVYSMAHQNEAVANPTACIEVETHAEVEARLKARAAAREKDKSLPPECVVRQQTRARPLLARIHAEPPPQDRPWRIDRYRDQMRRVDIVTACTPADQSADASPAMLCFESDANGQIIYIESTSRFTCSSPQCNVAARFGDAEIVQIPAVSDNGRLRFVDQADMESKIRRSSVVFVEARTSFTGLQQMRFDTSNLTWPPNAERTAASQ